MSLGETFAKPVMGVPVGGWLLGGVVVVGVVVLARRAPSGGDGGVVYSGGGPLPAPSQPTPAGGAELGTLAQQLQTSIDAMWEEQRAFITQTQQVEREQRLVDQQGMLAALRQLFANLPVPIGGVTPPVPGTPREAQSQINAANIVEAQRRTQQEFGGGINPASEAWRDLSLAQVLSMWRPDQYQYDVSTEFGLRRYQAALGDVASVRGVTGSHVVAGLSGGDAQASYNTFRRLLGAAPRQPLPADGGPQPYPMGA